MEKNQKSQQFRTIIACKNTPFALDNDPREQERHEVEPDERVLKSTKISSNASMQTDLVNSTKYPVGTVSMILNLLWWDFNSCSCCACKHVLCVNTITADVLCFYHVLQVSFALLAPAWHSPVVLPYVPGEHWMHIAVPVPIDFNSYDLKISTFEIDVTWWLQLILRPGFGA